MNREEKVSLVKNLHDQFVDSKASFIVGYKGLTVDQLQDLRGQLRNSGGTFRVAKARLLKKAFDGIDTAKDLDVYLKDQIGIVFTSEDAPGVAKALYTYAKSNDSLQLVAGFFEDRVLQKDVVVKLATLPSKEVLLSTLVSVLNAPIAKTVRTLSMMKDRIVFTVQAIAEQKK